MSGVLCGEIELNRQGDEVFDEEIEELQEELDEMEGDRSIVTRNLSSSKRLLALSVLYQGREFQEVADDIAPLWEVLDSKAPGLLQFDDHGYYNQGAFILGLED